MTTKTLPWQLAARNLITDPTELRRLLQLTTEQLPELDPNPNFPLRVSRAYVQRIHKGNPHDPLLRQILPTKHERIALPGYQQDPLQEQQANPIPGLLHKYHGRVLVMLTGSCAIHCRYCFRRYFPYAENTLGRRSWSRIYDYLAADTSIREVILSGGDPLMIKDELLAAFLQGLHDLKHLQRLRIHTRVPIMIPERITPALCTLLTARHWQSILVLHSNHAQELDQPVGDQLALLRQGGVTLLNQSVLLRGINDSAVLLAQLSERLFSFGVLPYYLHLLDPVSGTQEFAVTAIEAKAIMQQLQSQLPGFLVPKLVREQAGIPYKVLI